MEGRNSVVALCWTQWTTFIREVVVVDQSPAIYERETRSILFNGVGAILSHTSSFLTALFSVKSRSHQVDVSLHHYAPALVDENYPIVIEIKNTDNIDLVVQVDILLQPTDADGASKRFAARFNPKLIGFRFSESDNLRG